MYKHNVKENLGLFYMCIAKSKTTLRKSLQRKHVIEILRMESQKYAHLNHKNQTKYRTQKQGRKEHGMNGKT